MYPTRHLIRFKDPERGEWIPVRQLLESGSGGRVSRDVVSPAMHYSLNGVLVSYEIAVNYCCMYVENSIGYFAVNALNPLCQNCIF